MTTARQRHEALLELAALRARIAEDAQRAADLIARHGEALGAARRSMDQAVIDLRVAAYSVKRAEERLGAGGAASGAEPVSLCPDSEEPSGLVDGADSTAGAKGAEGRL